MSIQSALQTGITPVKPLPEKLDAAIRAWSESFRYDYFAAWKTGRGVTLLTQPSAPVTAVMPLAFGDNVPVTAISIDKLAKAPSGLLRAIVDLGRYGGGPHQAWAWRAGFPLDAQHLSPGALWGISRDYTLNAGNPAFKPAGDPATEELMNVNILSQVTTGLETARALSRRLPLPEIPRPITQPDIATAEQFTTLCELFLARLNTLALSSFEHDPTGTRQEQLIKVRIAAFTAKKSMLANFVDRLNVADGLSLGQSILEAAARTPWRVADRAEKPVAPEPAEDPEEFIL